jgi:hypothetical protein
MNSLWLTHYGFKILDALNVGVRHFGAELEDIRKSLDDLGFVLKTHEVDSLETAEIEDPVVCSQSMRNHILNLIEDAYL